MVTPLRLARPVLPGESVDAAVEAARQYAAQHGLEVVGVPEVVETATTLTVSMECRGQDNERNRSE